jgi:hypothetical protein
MWALLAWSVIIGFMVGTILLIWAMCIIARESDERSSRVSSPDSETESESSKSKAVRFPDPPCTRNRRRGKARERAMTKISNSKKLENMRNGRLGTFLSCREKLTWHSKP